MKTIRQKHEEAAGMALDARYFTELGIENPDLPEEVESLYRRLKESRANEAVCHCGALLSEHTQSDNHSAVAMAHPCPNEETVYLLRERGKNEKARADRYEKAAVAAGWTSGSLVDFINYWKERALGVSDLRTAATTVPILKAIAAERERQRAKWSEQHDNGHAITDWERFIAERLGYLAGVDKPFRQRMVEVAAIAVAAIEAHDRVGTTP